MLTQYGHVGIEWRGVDYTLSPTFANIAKLGSPAEIIDDFQSFITQVNPVFKFNQALIIINACSDIPLPEALTGKIKFSNKRKKFMYVKPLHQLPMFDDVITLAEHCLIHGICGKSKKKSTSGAPLKEFDAYAYMELARIHLGMSAAEAENMTMTEFARMMDAKFPPELNENEASEELSEDMLNWFNEQNKVH